MSMNKQIITVYTFVIDSNIENFNQNTFLNYKKKQKNYFNDKYNFLLIKKALRAFLQLFLSKLELINLIIEIL